MDIIYEIRRRHTVQKQTISAIAREMGISRPKVRKHLKTVADTRLNFSNSQRDFEEFIYETACLESIGNKGNRSDMVERPPEEALDNKRKDKKYPNGQQTKRPPISPSKLFD